MATIYDEIGGKDAVAAAVDRFYTHVMDDRVLAPYFADTDLRRQKGHLRAFITAAIGGPQLYSGLDMPSAHAGRGITEDAFERVAGHLVATLAGLGVAPDTIGAIGDRIAPLRSQIVSA